ncbi:MAG: nucleoside hydrolase [Chloroflexi bacterium]|nr:nucleoside hydrolase [Chloroflexota bacterium]
MRVHIDTDFGGDPDDACAVAMLLGSPDIEIVGITTNLDVGGRRAGCAQYFLEVAGHTDIPVVAGAGTSLTTLKQYESTWGDSRHWPDPVEPSPGSPGAALDLLQQNIANGATVIAIGALTNLAMLEVSRPGCLAGVPVAATAGWLRELPEGFPRWDMAMDFNVQCDTRAASIVAAVADLTLVTLPASIKAHLRATDLPRLRGAGRIGRLLAAQSEANAMDTQMSKLARSCSALPDDLVNFHWDPVTCAVAAGLPGATLEELLLTTEMDGDVLRFSEGPHGRRVRVVTDINADAFRERWLLGIESASNR